MKDNTAILEDISTLTKICNSKSDGPTLKIEENEIKHKISEYEQEIQDIKTIDVEDSYDTSAEMADRNIEIISKKIIQATTGEIKNKTIELDELKEKEKELSDNLNSLKRTKLSYEKYISSLKERLTSSSVDEVADRYNNLISETESKMVKQDERIAEADEKYQSLQSNINTLTSELTKLEEKLETKKSLLAEAQTNLENKEVYVDKVKKEKSEKRIVELEKKIEELNNRLEAISKDPKYLELKIREILTSGKDNFEARNYLIELINTASKVPYMDVYVDQSLEDKLTAATKERDDFASFIDKKTYDIMESLNPEQIRIDFLNTRIAYWQNELNKLQDTVTNIDKDANFHYGEKQAQIEELLNKLKEETKEFKESYEKESDSNLSNKAILKLTYEEKKADLDAAEEIASKFRKNEAEDAEEAGRIIKQDITRLSTKIKEAEDEIYQIKERLTNRKAGMKDLGAKNRDRERLSELAQVVIDIKHRRLFKDRTFDIAKRLEESLNIKLVDAVYTPEEKSNIEREQIPTEPIVVAEEQSVETQEPIEEQVVVNEEQPAIAIAEPSSDDNYSFDTQDMQPQEEEPVDSMQETTEINFEDSFPSVVEVEEQPAEENNLANAIPEGDPVVDIDPNLVSPV